MAIVTAKTTPRPAYVTAGNGVYNGYITDALDPASTATPAEKGKMLFDQLAAHGTVGVTDAQIIGAAAAYNTAATAAGVLEADRRTVVQSFADTMADGATTREFLQTEVDSVRAVVPPVNPLVAGLLGALSTQLGTINATITTARTDIASLLGLIASLATGLAPLQAQATAINNILNPTPTPPPPTDTIEARMRVHRDVIRSATATPAEKAAARDDLNYLRARMMANDEFGSDPLAIAAGVYGADTISGEMNRLTEVIDNTATAPADRDAARTARQALVARVRAGEMGTDLHAITPPPPPPTTGPDAATLARINDVANPADADILRDEFIHTLATDAAATPVAKENAARAIAALNVRSAAGITAATVPNTTPIVLPAPDAVVALDADTRIAASRATGITAATAPGLRTSLTNMLAISQDPAVIARVGAAVTALDAVVAGLGAPGPGPTPGPARASTRFGRLAGLGALYATPAAIGTIAFGKVTAVGIAASIGCPPIAIGLGMVAAGTVAAAIIAKVWKSISNRAAPAGP